MKLALGKQQSSSDNKLDQISLRGVRQSRDNHADFQKVRRLGGSCSQDISLIMV